MTARVFWFLPTAGDGRSIVGASHASSHRIEPVGFRRPSLRYLTEVAQAADRLEYEGVLTPTGTWCEDAWLTTAALLQSTRRLRFLVAFRPGLVPPTLAAQQAATLQRMSEGRLLLNIVTGGDDTEQRRFGDWVDHDRRYTRTDEFLGLVRRIWTEESVDHEGEFFRVADARVSEPPDPLPEFWFGGSSDPALAVAARRVQTYLTWGEPPAEARAKIERVQALADAEGRRLRYGVRLHTISRDTSTAAWAVAHRLLDELPREQIADAHRLHSSSQSEGQRRMAALHGGRTDSLEIYPICGRASVSSAVERARRSSGRTRRSPISSANTTTPGSPSSFSRVIRTSKRHTTSPKASGPSSTAVASPPPHHVVPPDLAAAATAPRR